MPEPDATPIALRAARALASSLRTAFRGARRAAYRLLLPSSHPVNRYVYGERVAAACGGRVAMGPFEGMSYVQESAGSAWWPKLLGTYEKELHGLIDRAVSGTHERIVNVGCGEGYYAVGMALRTGLRVHAYDLEPRARELTRQMAAANGVADRVVIGGRCDFAELQQFAGLRTLLVCDIEGDEAALLDPVKAPVLRDCDILVEVHDGCESGPIQRTLLERFAETHKSTCYRAVPRTFDDFPLRSCAVSRAWAKDAMDEGRALGLHWLYLEARCAAVAPDHAGAR